MFDSVVKYLKSLKKRNKGAEEVIIVKKGKENLVTLSLQTVEGMQPYSRYTFFVLFAANSDEQILILPDSSTVYRDESNSPGYYSLCVRQFM